MAKNDIFIVDSIISDRVEQQIPSNKTDEVFEILVYEQLLKDYDISIEQIKHGSVDGRNDGGIDAIFIFINGHLLDRTDDFMWPKSSAELEIFIITCKHHDTFNQQTINNLIPTLNELLDFSLEKYEGQYNEILLEKQRNILFTYKKLAPILSGFNVNIVYASRGDRNFIAENVQARANHVISLTESYFSSCKVVFNFFGCNELLKAYRKRKIYSLSIKYEDIISKGGNYILLCRLSEYFHFIIDEDLKLRRYLMDSNVRGYLGVNHVNKDIYTSLRKESDVDFWLLNNGITIVATQGNIVGKTIFLENVQIVNGLQTTETIYNFYKRENDRLTDDRRELLLKIIITKNEENKDKIIKATNNQTSVQGVSLFATEKLQKDIEDILLKYDFYYERRTDFYSYQGIDRTKIINPYYLACGYIALVLKEPASAVRYKKRHLNKGFYYNAIFNDKNNPIIWYRVVSLLKEVDNVISKEQINSSKRLLGNFKCVIAYLTAANYFKTFNYNTNDFCNFEVKQNQELLLEMFRFVDDSLLSIADAVKPGKSIAKNRKTIETICIEVAKKFNISDLDNLLRRKSIIFKNISFNESSEIELIELIDLAIKDENGSSLFIDQKLLDKLCMEFDTTYYNVKKIIYKINATRDEKYKLPAKRTIKLTD